jgi:hypothetical protein
MYWCLGFLGILLAIWPPIGGYSNIGSAVWASAILGLVIALPAGYKAATNDTVKWELMITGMAGAVTAFAPLFLGFGQAQTATGVFILIGGTVAWLCLLLSDVDQETEPSGDSAVSRVDRPKVRSVTG